MPPGDGVALTAAGFRRFLLSGTLSGVERHGEVKPRAAEDGGIKGRPLRTLLFSDREALDEGAQGAPQATSVDMGTLGKNCAPPPSRTRPFEHHSHSSSRLPHVPRRPTATALQDAVAELAQDEAGLAKLFRTYHSHDENGEYVLDPNEFRGCLAALLSFDIGVTNADRLFAALDYRRTGAIANDLLMDFLFPMGTTPRTVSARASGTVTAVHLSDDATKVGVGGAGFAKVIDLATGNALVAATYNHDVACVRFDRRAQSFYVATSDKVDEFDLRSKEEVFQTAGATIPDVTESDSTRVFKYANGRVLCVEVSTDGHFLLVGGTRKDILLFDRLAGLGRCGQAEPTPLITIPYPSSVTSVAMARQSSITLALPLATLCLLDR